MRTMLACRSDFSVGESILTVEDMIDEAKRTGQVAVAMTDTMCVTGMIDFTNRAKKAGVKPIIGTRLRMVDDAEWRPGPGQKKKDMPKEYFVTVYARDHAGMLAIYRLLTLASALPRFYYVPKLAWKDLYAELDAHQGLAVVLGDENGMLAHWDAQSIAGELLSRSEHVYAPIVPVNTPYYGRMNEIAIGFVNRMGLKPLLVRPVLYPHGKADAQEVMRAIAENHLVSDGFFRSRFNRDLHALTGAELIVELKACVAHQAKRGVTGAADVFRQATLNTMTFVNDISYLWSKAEVSLPIMAPDEFVAVKDLCKAGWKERFGMNVFAHRPDATELATIYMPRLKYELSVIEKLKFSGYFLLVADIVTYAKGAGILVGPGRGSVGGSLIAYLMGITDCDPIRFGLLFERFINPDRIDLPDADLDFMSERRHEIVTYLINKYGEKRVAGVSNFGTLAAASAMRDVGRVTGIPERNYSVSKLVPKLHGANVPLEQCREQVPEIDTFATEFADYWPLMTSLEGKIRNFSTHAAGIVVSGCDLVERAVVETRKESAVVCWDKRIVEDQGLVKVDILGLNTLDIMKLALDYIRERHGRAPDINGIDLRDPKVLERFAQGKTTGVFQFESGGMRRLLKELGSDGTITFEDITACTALYRPGPMESGMMDSFYKRKQGNETIEYDHPLMEEVLRETFGVMVYQEQIMRVSQVIAGYSGAAADKLRKIMGKKLPEEMKKERGNFVNGCIATVACTEEWAGALFDKIEGFAGYGFNKSHSVEYTLISYQCMWLKTYYPVEFYAAALTRLDEEKLPALLRDAKAEGIVIETPNINLSTLRYEIITDTRLCMPFQAIKGLSDKTGTAILNARAPGPFLTKADFLARVEKRSCNIKHQDCLDRVGAFAWIELTQPKADDPSRVRDQIELLPGLISASVPINHDMHQDKDTKQAIADLHDDARAKYASENEGMLTKPHFGRKAKFMIIADCPSSEEDGNGIFGISRGNSAVLEAMSEVGLDLQDVYWTGLIKRPKRGRQVTNEEIVIYADLLKEEISILNPPVIVLLGSQTVRTWLPTLKGKASEAAGKIVHFNDIDANAVIAFSPGEIYHDPEKQGPMNEVFAKVAELLA